MATTNNPATADQDMAGLRVRNAAPSLADDDYVTRDELEGVINTRNDARYLMRNGANSATDDIPFASHTITGIRDAAAAQEPATKAQLDAVAAASATDADVAALAATVAGLSLGIRGELIYTNGSTLNAANAWVVPAGVTRVAFLLVGPGGGGSDGVTDGGDGGTTSITGSTSGAIASVGGGQGGDNAAGSASGGTAGSGAGIGIDGGNGGPAGGTTGVGGAAGGGSGYDKPGAGRFGRGGDYGGAALPAGYGNGGGGLTDGGGGAGGGVREGLATVVPGETLTITVGGRGSGPGSAATGASGLAVIRW